MTALNVPLVVSEPASTTEAPELGILATEAYQ